MWMELCGEEWFGTSGKICNSFTICSGFLFLCFSGGSLPIVNMFHWQWKGRDAPIPVSGLMLIISTSTCTHENTPIPCVDTSVLFNFFLLDHLYNSPSPASLIFGVPCSSGDLGPWQHSKLWQQGAWVFSFLLSDQWPTNSLYTAFSLIQREPIISQQYHIGA